MKHSIHKIFKNLNLSLFILFILSTLSFIFVVKQYFSFEKIKSINIQEVDTMALKKLFKDADSERYSQITLYFEISKCLKW